MDSKRIKHNLAWTVAIVLAVLWAIAAFLPFVYMVLNSFKDRIELMTGNMFALPKVWQIGNYIEVLSGHFMRYFLNSVIVVAVSLILLLLISAAAAYPLGRFNFGLAKPAYSAIIACMSIPVHITLIPIFMMSIKTGLYDSIFALIGPYIAFALPISVFILTGFMKGIPLEIEEAAKIDGCSRFQEFFRIMLPMCRPGLVTIAIYNGVQMWNEFSFAYTLTQNWQHRTLPLSIWEYKGQYNMNTPLILTVLTLSVLPMLILFIITKDKLIEGMCAGAVKG